MVINKQTRQKRPNYFMTDTEVAILWKYSKRWSTKFQMILAFALFRGLRIGEILAINLLDFSRDFTQLRVIMQKSGVEDWLPLPAFLSEMVKGYVAMNLHTFKDGYLFPYYTRRFKIHMDTPVAVALFCKLRKIIGKDHPEFLDHTFTKNGVRYRIGLHSCRRWFETRLYDDLGDRKKLADVMRYLDASTVDSYIDPYQTWKKEKSLLESAFSAKYGDFEKIGQGQTRLMSYFEK